jgi:hypothetical protein
MRLTDAEIAAIVCREIEQAQGYDSDVLSTKRQMAQDYYNGLLPAAPAAGRSAIVSMDVADSVHSLLAQISPIIKSTIVEFDSKSEEDEKQAQLESDFVRTKIEEEDGYEVVFSAVHDALLMGNGWIKVYVEEEEEVTEEVYPPALDMVQQYVLTQPTAPEQEVTATESDTKFVVKRTTKKRELEIDSVPPANMLFSAGYGNGDLDDQRFVAELKLFTASQLREIGISQAKIDAIPDALEDDNQVLNSIQGIYRDDGSQAVQEAERLKKVYCCYIRLDLSGNNKSQLYYVWIGGQTLLKKEPADYVPYLTGSAIPTPHRVQGTGVFELLKSIQDGKTGILRAYMDNLSVMNQSRLGVVEGMVNMTDLTNGRINGVVRMRSPDAIVPLPSADIGPQAMAGLSYMDQVRVQRIGASLDLNELQAQLMSASATAAAGQLGQVEKMSGWYATNLVETLVKPLFLMVHKVMRKEFPGPRGAKMRGAWQQTDPGQWQDREVASVLMGMTTQEKASRINALSQVITAQNQMLQAGGAGVLVDNSRLYNAMCDWIRANDLKAPDEYLIDPTSQAAQQAQQAQAQQQQAQQKKMEDLQREMVQMQHHFELLKQQKDLEYKVWSDQLDAEVEEAKITSSAVIDIKKINAPSAKQ